MPNSDLELLTEWNGRLNSVRTHLLSALTATFEDRLVSYIDVTDILYTKRIAARDIIELFSENLDSPIPADTLKTGFFSGNHKLPKEVTVLVPIDTAPFIDRLQLAVEKYSVCLSQLYVYILESQLQLTDIYESMFEGKEQKLAEVYRDITFFSEDRAEAAKLANKLKENYEHVELDQSRNEGNEHTMREIISNISTHDLEFQTEFEKTICDAERLSRKLKNHSSAISSKYKQLKKISRGNIFRLFSMVSLVRFSKTTIAILAGIIGLIGTLVGVLSFLGSDYGQEILDSRYPDRTIFIRPSSEETNTNSVTP